MYYMDVFIATMVVLSTRGKSIDFSIVATYENLPILGVGIVE